MNSKDKEIVDNVKEGNAASQEPATTTTQQLAMKM